VKWREAKGRRDQGTPAIGGSSPALIAVRGLYRWVAVQMGKMERRGADLTWEKDAPWPWRPPLVCNWTPLMPPTDHGAHVACAKATVPVTHAMTDTALLQWLIV